MASTYVNHKFVVDKHPNIVVSPQIKYFSTVVAKENANLSGKQALTISQWRIVGGINDEVAFFCTCALPEGECEGINRLLVRIPFLECCLMKVTVGWTVGWRKARLPIDIQVRTYHT